jgi:hypothetical protein
VRSGSARRELKFLYQRTSAAVPANGLRRSDRIKNGHPFANTEFAVEHVRERMTLDHAILDVGERNESAGIVQTSGKAVFEKAAPRLSADFSVNFDDPVEVA